MGKTDTRGFLQLNKSSAPKWSNDTDSNTIGRVHIEEKRGKKEKKLLWLFTLNTLNAPRIALCAALRYIVLVSSLAVESQ